MLGPVIVCDRKEASLDGKNHRHGLGVSLGLFGMLPGADAKALEQRAIEVFRRTANDGLQFTRCLVQHPQPEIRKHALAAVGLQLSATTSSNCWT